MRAALLALVGVWWLAHALHLPVAGTVAGMLLLNFVPGAALVRLWGFGRNALAWRVAAAGALSPPLVAGIGLVAGLAGVPPEQMSWPIVAAGVLVLLVADRKPDQQEESPPFERVLVLAGAALAAFVAVALLHPRLPRWSDSWFHAAVFHEVQRAGIHPTFPHFAGMPLPYPWFFHLYLVMAAPLVHRDPFILMATVNQWTALLLPVSFYALARALGTAPRIAMWAPIVGFFGVNPFGGLILLVRNLVGETRGWHQLRSEISNADFVQSGLAFHFPGFQSSWLARLWTPSAFNFALILAAFVLTLLVRFQREPRTRTLLLFSLAMLLLLHWHTLTALQLSFGITVGMVLAALARVRADGWRAFGPALAVAAAMLVAFLVARPYLTSVTLGGSASVVHLALVGGNLAGFLLSMGPVLLAALVALPGLDERARPWAAGAMAGLAFPMLAFDLPGQAEEKLFWPLFVLVAAIGAPVLARMWQRGWIPRTLLTGMLVCSLLTTGFTAVGFLGESRPMRTMFDDTQPQRAAFYTPDERAALDWIRTRAPRDAVFLQPLRRVGTEPILVHGERRVWLGFADVFYRATFFETKDRPPIPLPVWNELQHRDSLQRRAFSDDSLTAGDLEDLRSRPWPIYVWWDQSLAQGRLSPTLSDTVRVSRLVFNSPSVHILQLRDLP
jgi:hypothetical protein